jgi:hypothetical protein
MGESVATKAGREKPGKSFSARKKNPRKMEIR